MKQKEIIVDSTLILAELAECWELLKRTLCLLIGHLILLLFVDGKHALGKDFLKKTSIVTVLLNIHEYIVQAKAVWNLISQKDS